jgi:hypothetical protein
MKVIVISETNPSNGVSYTRILSSGSLSKVKKEMRNLEENIPQYRGFLQIYSKKFAEKVLKASY